MRTARTLERIGSCLIYAHHGLVVAVGAFGLIESPSPAVAEVIGGTFVAILWSVMFVIFGLAALACRIANRVLKWLDTTRSEAICLALIGAAMFLFSAMIIYATVYVDSPPTAPDDLLPGQPGAIQTALALLSSSLFLPGVAAIALASIRVERLAGKQNTTDVMHAVRDQLRDEIRRTGSS